MFTRVSNATGNTYTHTETPQNALKYIGNVFKSAEIPLKAFIFPLHLSPAPPMTGSDSKVHETPRGVRGQSGERRGERREPGRE